VSTELKVKIRHKNQALQVYLAIPSIRAFIDGGLLDGKKDEYGFFKKDGTIPLPPNTAAWILAMAESDGKIYFNVLSFTTLERKEFDLSLKEVTPEQFNRAIHRLGFDNFDISLESAAEMAERKRIADSLDEEKERIEWEKMQKEREARIKEIDRRIDSLRPKSKACECICAAMQGNQADSAVSEYAPGN
jgi:hypothetical protein